MGGNRGRISRLPPGAGAVLSLRPFHPMTAMRFFSHSTPALLPLGAVSRFGMGVAPFGAGAEFRSVEAGISGIASGNGSAIRFGRRTESFCQRTKSFCHRAEGFYRRAERVCHRAERVCRRAGRVCRRARGVCRRAMGDGRTATGGCRTATDGRRTATGGRRTATGGCRTAEG